MERDRKDFQTIIGEIIDVLVKHECTVEEAEQFLRGARNQLGLSPVQKTEIK